MNRRGLFVLGALVAAVAAIFIPRRKPMLETLEPDLSVPLSQVVPSPSPSPTPPPPPPSPPPQNDEPVEGG